MNLYEELLRQIAAASAQVTLAAGAVVVLPIRALRRRLTPAEPTMQDWLRIRTDRPLAADEIEFALQLPAGARRSLDRRVTGRPAWEPEIFTRTV